jgi:hypothetical protein
MKNYALPASDPCFVSKFNALTEKLPNGCWRLTNKATSSGYSIISYQRRTYLAHRLAYFIANGIPSKPVIRHLCHNRPCINPDHLVEGTHWENSNDMATSLRSTGKLNASAVREIRAKVPSSRDHRAVARMMIKYNVGASVIIGVITGGAYLWV